MKRPTSECCITGRQIEVLSSWASAMAGACPSLPIRDLKICSRADSLFLSPPIQYPWSVLSIYVTVYVLSIYVTGYALSIYVTVYVLSIYVTGYVLSIYVTGYVCLCVLTSLV